MGKRSQRKGRDAEKELASIFKQHGFPVKVGSALNFGNEPDIHGLPFIHCEVKRCEHLNISKAMQQAIADAEKFGGAQTVFHRRSREQWYATMLLTDWIALYRGIHHG